MGRPHFVRALGHRGIRRLLLGTGALALLCTGLPGCGPAPEAGMQDGRRGTAAGQWRNYGGDPGGTKYAPLAQITRDNFADLEIAWSWDSGALAWRGEWLASLGFKPAAAKASPRPNVVEFQSTPLMVDGVLYGTTPVGVAFALEAHSGTPQWTYDPKIWTAAKSVENLGQPKNRGLAWWRDGSDARVLMTTFDAFLIALDARTGEPIADFGENGRIDLLRGLRGPPVERLTQYHVSSPPIIHGDTVIVGGSVSDNPKRGPGITDGLRAYDVRSGAHKWTFNLIPSAGEFGTESWDDEGWREAGGGNAWAPKTLDSERGLLYVGTSSPTNDYFGGHRLGNNLFTDSLLCVDIATGQRVWHQQLIRHDLWDYDVPAPPNLIDVRQGEKTIPAVTVATKQGFVFTFDRVTGDPIWPLVEKPAPASSVPGERAASHQRHPTRPPPFERIGLTKADLIDFKPELTRAALDVLEPMHWGALYTPPSTKGTVLNPGSVGGANWPGAAYDPETGTLFVPSITMPTGIAVYPPPEGKSDFDHVGFAFLPVTLRLKDTQGGALPITKPPYSRVTAYDMNAGNILWQSPLGEGPRKHPLLAELNLPRLGSGALGCALATKSLVIVSEGKGWFDARFRGPNLWAFDKATGQVVGVIALPATPRGCPMTYVAEGRQFIAVGVGDPGLDPQLIALALPETDRAR
jgi:quinoprotein glucose dehydrogenase